MTDSDLWFPPAIRSDREWSRNSMYKNTSARRCVHHWTATKIGSNPLSIEKYMANVAGLRTGYTILMPMNRNQRPLQLRPANYAAGSLYYDRNSLVRSPNREGTCNVQIGWICTTGDDPFLKGPGDWWDELHDWLLNACGIPDSYVDQNWTPNRIMTKAIWYSSNSGHTAHKQVPERGYIRKPDPGSVIDRVLFGTGEEKPPIPIPPPSDSKFVLDFDGGAIMSLRYLKRTDPMMRGGDVKSLQGVLNQKNFNAEAEDGIFGDNTQAAVKRAQQALGIQVDGVVGPVTHERLWER